MILAGFGEIFCSLKQLLLLFLIACIQYNIFY